MSENTNMPQVDLENRLSWKHRVGYGAGDAGGVVTLTIIQAYMTRYVTNVLEVPYATLSILLLIWNIWDTVNDPMVGGFMDKAFEKQDSTKDKFRPWIKASIPLIFFGLIAFFAVPGLLDGLWAVIALFILKIVYEFGYTMMNIGMGSLLGAMATNDTERSALSSARGIGSTIGGLIGALAIPQVLAQFGETKTGYAIAGVVVAVLGCILIWVHYAWTEERNASAKLVVDDEADTGGAKFSDIFTVFKENRAFLALSLHSIIIVFGTTVYNQIAPYMFADVLGDIALMGYSTTISSILTLVILGFAPRIVQKIGSTVKLIRFSLIIGATLLIALYFVLVNVGVSPLVYLLWSAVGFALINLSVQLQWGLVSDSIDYNEYLTGKRTEGSIYGTFSLTRRIGQTLSQSLIVLMIGWIGYNPDLTNQGLAQADGTIAWLQILALLVPAIAAFGSWFCFKFIWNIDDKLRLEMSEWKLNRVQGSNDIEEN